MKKDEYLQYVTEAFHPAESLIRMVPADKLGWKPGPGFMSMGELICHLSEGIGEALQKTIRGNWPKPEELESSMKAPLPACSVQEALERLEHDRATLSGVLSEISEEDFDNTRVSVPWGLEAKMERMALHFLEHFFHHKMQLFMYLKLLGFPVNTATLYFG